MPTAPIHRMLAVLPLVSLLACGQDSAGPSRMVPTQAQYAFAQSEWSAPVNIGTPINSTAGEMNAALSPDELSLYFTSDRLGGLGITDIWVSHRNCGDCPWQTPVNLGAPFNSSSQDAGPRLSDDGHLLFFQSDRPVGSNVGGDIYVSRRNNPNDDFGWGPPVRLGPDVNTPEGTENAAAYLQSAEDGGGNLYFNRTTATVPMPELYVASITRDGETRGPATPVSELNVVSANDQHATIRKDGREIFFSSNRAGGLGGFDVWTSTRRSVHDPWSPPEDIGAPVNTASTDQQPSLSSDGRTLVFASNRPGGLGGSDLWIATRTPSGR